MLKSANCRWQFSGERLADAQILQRNCSPVHFPSLSLQERNLLRLYCDTSCGEYQIFQRGKH